MWFKENRPELFDKTWKCAGLQEFILLRLGLSPRIDYSLAGRTMLLDLRQERYALDLFEFAGIDEDTFFPLSRAIEVCGELNGITAEKLGLQPGTRVVPGGFDQSCCAVGAGVIEPGTAANSIGTLEAITPVFDRPRIELPLLTGNHGCIPGLVQGMFTSLGYVTTAGAVVKWYVDSFGDRRGGGDLFAQAMSELPVTPSSVFVLPYFAGTGTPWLDVHQTGSVFGLSLDTKPGDILKGILEGVAFEARVNIESFIDGDIPVNTLRVTGGGSKSDSWMQIKADISGIPVEGTTITEAGCRGAAFLAGLGTGVYSRVQDILDITEIDAVYEPDTKQNSLYEERYRTYLDLRERVKGLSLNSVSIRNR